MNSDIQPNLKVLKRSRKKPQDGDIFTLSPTDKFLFGRVLRADINNGEAPTPWSYLIYIYQAQSPTKEPDLSLLTRDKLLISPLFINQLPWTKGYFEKILHRQLSPADKLEQHCFYDLAKGKYVDDRGHPIPKKIEPCGNFALNSYWSLDDMISDALGIPRAPHFEEKRGRRV